MQAPDTTTEAGATSANIHHQATETANPAASAAVQEVVGGRAVHVLHAPYQFDDITHTSVVLDLKSLTGKDLSELQQQWTGLGFFSMQVEVDDDFCALAAARAAGQVPDFIEGLPAPDYTALVTLVKVFLQGENIARTAAKDAGKAEPAPALAMDLAVLTGRDLSQVKRAWVGKGGNAGFSATDLSYCSMVAARAAGVALEQVQALPAPTYICVVREVTHFLQR